MIKNSNCPAGKTVENHKSDNQQYRWSATVENVYAFCGVDGVSTMASYKNEVSGFVKKSKLAVLRDALKAKGVTAIQLVTPKRYWLNFDLLNA